jgi:hypothetical protein
MMHPADHREGGDLPPIVGLALAEFGGILIEREVDPGSVIVNDCALDGVLRRDSMPPLLLVGDLTYEVDLLMRGQTPGTGDKEQLKSSFAKVRAPR